MTDRLNSLRAASERPAVRVLFWFLFLLIPTTTWLNDGDAFVQYFALAFYVALISLWLVARRGRDGVALPFSFLPYFAYLGWMLLRFPASPITSHALEITLDFALFGLLILLLFNLHGDLSSYGPAELALLGLGGLFAVVNAVLILNWFSDWLPLVAGSGASAPFAYRLPGTLLGHANIEAGFVGLLLPLVLVRLVGAQSRYRKLGWAGLMVAFFFVEYFSSSRAGWISAAAGLTTTLLLLSSLRLDSDRWLPDLTTVRRKLRARWPLLVVLALVAVGIVAVLWFQATNTPHQPLASARTNVWNAGLAAFRLAPLLGSGPGAAHVLVVMVDRLASGVYFIHPHNLILLLLDEGGLIGLGLIAAGFPLFVRAALRRWRDLEGGERVQAAGVAGALMTAAVHNQADVLFEAPIYALAVLMLLTQMVPRSKAATIRVPAWLVGVLLAAFAAAQLLSLRGIGALERGVQAMAVGDTPRGERLICDAAAAYPGYALASTQCALAVSLRPVDGAATRALAHQRRAVDADPYWPTHWLNLGVLQWQTGNRPAAMGALAQAEERAPYDPRVLANYGWMAESSGELGLAERLYRTLLEQHPELADSVFFAATGFRGELVRSGTDYAFENEVERLTIEGWQLYNAGDGERARGAFEAALAASARNDRARAGLSLALQALGQEQTAWRQAQIALLGESAGPRVLLAAGQVAAAQGRGEQAEQLLQRGWSALDTRNDSQRYYTIVYRRALLPTDVVPGVIDPRLTRDMARSLQTLRSLQRRAGDIDQAAAIEAYLSSAAGRPD